ncbi:MAG: DNA/RNA helicase, superfamily II [Parcubacteria group bacterium GW2011_GWA2_36_24]|nr:MAG: DNA/RNA helicase, superfamily II [Parcubacteria group bacterium GW2011_GWA2_36_24]
MYKSHSVIPKKFGSHVSSFRAKKFNNSRPRTFKRGGNKRFGGERIDFSRFIKKNVYVEEKPYISKYTFADFPFNPQLHKNIKGAGFVSPRPIQDQAIPTVLAGKDVFGMANTGTGKTAAFLLPLIEKISKTKGLSKRETVLIMAPTRELALQIESDFKILAFGFGMFSVSCVGGLPIMKQIREIKLGVSFVIGTPGRLRDLIDKKVLDLSTCHSVVLDEADRMLDMGFRDEMVYIIGKTPKERQTLFFSATLSADIKKLTGQYLKNPVFISVVSGETLKNIDQDVIRARSKEEKLEKLHEVLKKDGSDKVLIFREMKHSVDSLAKEGSWTRYPRRHARHQLRRAANLRYLCAQNRPNRPKWQKRHSVDFCAGVKDVYVRKLSSPCLDGRLNMVYYANAKKLARRSILR